MDPQLAYNNPLDCSDHIRQVHCSGVLETREGTWPGKSSEQIEVTNGLHHCAASPNNVGTNKDSDEH